MISTVSVSHVCCNTHNLVVKVTELWRSEAGHEGVNRAMFSLKALKRNLPCISPGFSWWPATLAVPWLVDASLPSLPPSSHGAARRVYISLISYGHQSLG